MHRHPAKRGFTLIEVLVALVVVAMASAAVLEAISGAADNANWLRERSFAQWVALNRIAEQRLATTPPSDGKSQGEVDFAGRRWRWQQVIEAPNEFGLRRIEVSVRELLAASGANNDDDENASFTASVSGIIGIAIAAPTGDDPDWEPAGPGSPGGPGGNPPLSPGQDPNNTTTPQFVPPVSPN
jgi:general secretion pathway protein I